jgi:hypothetical protein
MNSEDIKSSPSLRAEDIACAHAQRSHGVSPQASCGRGRAAADPPGESWVGDSTCPGSALRHGPFRGRQGGLAGVAVEHKDQLVPWMTTLHSLPSRVIVARFGWAGMS